MISEEHKKYKEHSFDSFCKKVLKCEAYNGYREIRRRLAHENTFSEIPEEVLKELSSYDYYACEDTVFYICEHMITIKNSQLAEALLALPRDDQEILLMYWF